MIGTTPLWHAKSTRATIRDFSLWHDVFACSVGDCDQSFDFIYYADGKLQRKYVVVDPDFKGGEVEIDHGIPFDVELMAFMLSDPTNIVLSIASSLEIRLARSPQNLRVYASD